MYCDANSSETRKFCSLIERSVVAKRVRCTEPKINVYKSEFLIVSNETDPRQCELIYISKIDLRYNFKNFDIKQFAIKFFRGKTSYWYKNVYGEMVAEQIQRLRSKFIGENCHTDPRSKKTSNSHIETVV